MRCRRNMRVKRRQWGWDCGWRIVQFKWRRGVRCIRIKWGRANGYEPRTTSCTMVHPSLSQQVIWWFSFLTKKYNLTLSGFQSLLQLIRTHCPQINKCAKSVYKLKSFITEKFGGSDTPTTFRYCAVCCKKVKEGRTCATPGCTGKSKPLVQFYAGDLTPQLKKRMEGICLTLSFPIWDSKQLFLYWLFKRWIAPISTHKSLSSE